jgi:hypothetical protein
LASPPPPPPPPFEKDLLNGLMNCCEKDAVNMTLVGYGGLDVAEVKDASIVAESKANQKSDKIMHENLRQR